MAIIVGTRFGFYEITALLGKGGMGEVYRAHDTKLKRDVAIKILPDEFSRDPERLSRFQREAEVLASLNHPNIGSIYDLQKAGDSQFLVLELVEGETLAQRTERGPLPVAEVLTIALRMCEALEAAHEKGVIHRDLKPANVKVTPEGNVKVLDFGLAKAIEIPALQTTLSNSPTLGLTGTNPGVILGTTAYMSPEQAKGKSVDKRADIWAFGVIVYEMLTGQRPFSGETAAETLAAIMMKEPDWTALPAHTPAHLSDLIRRCLVKELRNRGRDIGDVRIAMESAAKDFAPGQHDKAIATGRRERIAWSAAAVFMLVALLLGAWTLRPAPSSGDQEMRVEINTPASALPLQFALSPDGGRLAFVAFDNGVQRLWVRSLNAEAAQSLPGTDGASLPFWSPDSRSLGFFATGKLKRIEIDGGAPQILADAAAGRGGTWNRDGVILFSPSAGTTLSRIAETGGVPKASTQLEQGQVSQHRFPQFLQDGKHFIFDVRSTPDRSGTYLGSLDNNDIKRLIAADGAAWLPPGWLLYLQQGTLRAQRLDLTAGALIGNPTTIANSVGYDTGYFNGGFAVSPSGIIAYRASAGTRTQLMWFDRMGKMLGTVGEPDVESLGYPELSPDGRRVAVDRIVQGNQDVWLIDLIRGGAQRFTFDSAIDRRALWSTDGTQILFSSNRKNAFDLYMKAASGAGAEQLVIESSYTKNALSWSSHGRSLLYSEDNPKTARDLWALPMQADGKPIPVVNSQFDERNGQFSPDGRWMAYHSDESGRFEIYVVPFPSGAGKWQISTAGGLSPRWRHDGKELFFVAPTGQMMAASVSASATSFVSAPPLALFQSRIVSGGADSQNKHQYTVSADGRFLINVSAASSTTAPVMLLLNWKPPTP
jgi:eukaryotic-like serine/threonine-protein kinase